MFYRLLNTKAALAFTLVTGAVLGSFSSNETRSGEPSVTISSSLGPTITVDTTLYGNQSTSETVEIAEGVTLKLLGGNNYEFTSGLIIKGTLQVGNASAGMEGLSFTVSGNTLDISGKLDIQNAEDENAGLITLCPDYFINTGSIEISLSEDNLGKTLFGPFINMGTVDLSGTNLYSSTAKQLTRRDGSSTVMDGNTYLHGNSVYHVNGPLTGNGTIHLESYSILVLQETQSFNGPEISLEGGTLQVKLTDQGSTTAPITLKGYKGQNELTMENDIPFLMYDAEAGVLTCDVDDVVVQFTIGTEFDSSGFYVSSGYVISYNYYDTANFVDYREPTKITTKSSKSQASETSGSSTAYSNAFSSKSDTESSMKSFSAIPSNTATGTQTARSSNGEPLVTSGPTMTFSGTVDSNSATDILTESSYLKTETANTNPSTGDSSKESISNSLSTVVTTSNMNDTTTGTGELLASTSSLAVLSSTQSYAASTALSTSESFSKYNYSSVTQSFVSSSPVPSRKSTFVPSIPTGTGNIISTADPNLISFSATQIQSSSSAQTGFYSSSLDTSSLSGVTTSYETNTTRLFSTGKTLKTEDVSSTEATMDYHSVQFTTVLDPIATKVITLTSCSAQKCIERTITNTYSIATEASVSYTEIESQNTNTSPQLGRTSTDTLTCQNESSYETRVTPVPPATISTRTSCDDDQETENFERSKRPTSSSAVPSRTSSVASNFVSYTTSNIQTTLSSTITESKATSVNTCKGDGCNSVNKPTSRLPSFSEVSSSVSVIQSEAGATAATYTNWSALLLILGLLYLN